MKLEIGYHHPFEIRKYIYPLEKASGIRILYLSDLHFNRWTRRLAGSVSGAVNNIQPDIILLGGDYADSRQGLRHFRYMMRSIAHHTHIFAVPGNHDRWRIQQVRKIVGSSNGVWLEDTSAVIKVRSLTVRIDGGSPVTPSNGSGSTSPDGPTLPNDDPADLSILCLHRPVDIRKVAHRYHLAFAGHLHGSQFVLWTTPNGLYPGRLIYTWNRLSADIGSCRYLISKGLGDTLPIRFNCRKDILLVETGPIHTP